MLIHNQVFIRGRVAAGDAHRGEDFFIHLLVTLYLLFAVDSTDLRFEVATDFGLDVGEFFGGAW